MTIKEKMGKAQPSQNSKPKRRKTTPQKPAEQAKGASPVKEERFKERWLELNSDVHSALCYWNDLTQKYDGKMNRDQEQLQEIKSLLKDLQKKLKVFGE